RGKASDRKLRLLAVACCRRVAQSPGGEKIGQVIEVVEKYADGVVSESELALAQVVAHGNVEVFTREKPAEVLLSSHSLAWGNWRETLRHCARAKEWAYPDECVAQSSLFRCVFVNVFRPVTINPTWQTANVTALAQAIYDDRAFDRLPILADA